MSQVWHGPQALSVPLIAERHSRRMVFSLFVGIAGGASIALIAALSFWTDHPLVVPSLGPTAFLVFNRSQSHVSRPKNIVVGHFIGAISGFVSLAVFGLLHAPAVTEGGLSASRIGAAALSIALTSAVMILVDAEHGPATATTLIVSLGFMKTFSALALLMGGVALLAIEGLLIDRFVGLDLPLWSDRKLPAPGTPQRGRLVVLRGAERKDDHGDGRRPPVRTTWQNAGKYVVAPHEGRPVSLAEGQGLVKLDGAPSGRSYSVLEVVLDARPSVPLVHVHAGFTESYLILEGQVCGHVGSDKVRAGPGALVWVPDGVPHALYNGGNEPARFLCMTTSTSQSSPEFIP